MKINPMHSVKAYQKSQEVQERQKKDHVKKQDQVEISPEAKKLANTPGISADRMERVQEVKEQVNNGTYKVNPEEVAKKLYDFWNK
ncbi:flagellar biosynthesis anti-sigma factor FlgM [Salipaludibacillus neizhouensis]|uniref:Negative regulator of flagellin synthesis n=1 Tax=Salipaludibacillus neizhouensis TaxID=885475 RepID=A0A3A9K6Y8_9BACI|nr:flagellar biosynthesis anti-sigma factor FlgM [Salipaludibacillus neizhouensis]RKL68327.1 flagellar biosynthesis anti-sigma factor FlgM [Salipaludibacillus neizhouensis]